MTVTTTSSWQIQVFLLLLKVALIKAVCQATSGEIGYRSGPAIVDVDVGADTRFQCYYIGPSYTSCSGSCNNHLTLSTPHDLNSLDEVCECCNAQIVLYVEQVLECGYLEDGQSLDDVTWTNYTWYYYLFESCDCEALTGHYDGSYSRKRRSADPGVSHDCKYKKGHIEDYLSIYRFEYELTMYEDNPNSLSDMEDEFGTSSHKQRCVAVNNTIFTAKCHPDSCVSVCAALVRPTISASTRKQYRTMIATDMQKKTLKPFYPIPPSDIKYTSYSREKFTKFPYEIFRTKEMQHGDDSDDNGDEISTVTKIVICGFSVMFLVSGVTLGLLIYKCSRPPPNKVMDM